MYTLLGKKNHVTVTNVPLGPLCDGTFGWITEDVVSAHVHRAPGILSEDLPPSPNDWLWFCQLQAAHQKVAGWVSLLLEPLLEDRLFWALAVLLISKAGARVWALHSGCIECVWASVCRANAMFSPFCFSPHLFLGLTLTQLGFLSSAHAFLWSFLNNTVRFIKIIQLILHICVVQICGIGQPQVENIWRGKIASVQNIYRPGCCHYSLNNTV